LPERDDIHLLTLRDYGRVVWVRKWLVLAIVVAITAAAYLVANSKPRVYRATATLGYQQPLSIGSLISGGTSTDANTLALEMQSAVGLAGGPAVADLAHTLLGSHSASLPHYSVAVTSLAPAATTASTVGSSTLAISAESPAAVASAAIANAYAQAFMALRKNAQAASLRAAAQAVRQQMSAFKTTASRQSTDYLLLAQELRSVLILAATSNGDFAVVLPATPPSAPFSPRPMRSAAIGLGVGLFVGIGLALVLSQFDTRVRTSREVSEELGLPIIGRIPRNGRAAFRDAPLGALKDPDGQFAEALRRVRSVLDASRSEGGPRVLLFTSRQPKEGKTLTICNLAVTLAYARRKVVLVDADLRSPRVHEAFGLPNDVGLTNVVGGELALTEVLRPVPLGGGVRGSTAVGVRPASQPVAAAPSYLVVLTSGSLRANPGEIVVSADFERLMRQLRLSGVDYILVDSPPFGAVGDAASLATYVDGLVLVVGMREAKVPGLAGSREFLQTLTCKKVGVIAVGAEPSGAEYYGYPRTQES
jgi:Mrp family chromosome partitioning ATPase/capsular polysaccharide biosynthesis protein